MRATRNTGVTRDEVREMLLQVAVYAGVPAANSRVRARRRGVHARSTTRSDAVIASSLTYARERAGTQPPYDYPAYDSTVKRHPDARADRAAAHGRRRSPGRPSTTAGAAPT